MLFSPSFPALYPTFNARLINVPNKSFHTVTKWLMQAQSNEKANKVKTTTTNSSVAFFWSSSH